MKFVKCDLQDVRKIAYDVSQNISKGNVLALYGDFGAGKTTFAKFVISFILKNNIEDVTSPSYSLVNLYEKNGYSIFHYDFYRISSLKQIKNLSIEEDFENGISLIEWPQLVENILPKEKTFKIFFENCVNSSFKYIKILH